MSRICELASKLYKNKGSPQAFRSAMVVQLSIMADEDAKLLAELIVKGCKQYNVKL